MDKNKIVPRKWTKGSTSLAYKKDYENGTRGFSLSENNLAGSHAASFGLFETALKGFAA
jgi:hypothetical protein